MALSRMILLLAVGAHVLLVSSQAEHRIVHLARIGETQPEDMLYDEGKSPSSTEVSSEITNDDRRNSSSQQLVPQIEIAYDSKGNGWVDQVKQVPDPTKTATRGARRAENPRKDIIGTEIINDVAYLEIRHEKGEKSPPLISVRRADETSTEAVDTTRTGKIRYSQIPYKDVPTLGGSVSEEIQDYSQDESTTTTTTAAPTPSPSANSEEDIEETETSAQQPSNTESTAATEAEDDEDDTPDYPEDAAGSEDEFSVNATTLSSRLNNSTTTPSTLDNDYDEDDEEDEEETHTVATPQNPTETSVNATEQLKQTGAQNDSVATSAPLPTTIRRIPISQITTPSVDFAIPTEPVIVQDQKPASVTEKPGGNEPNEEEADDGDDDDDDDEETADPTHEVDEEEPSSEQPSQNNSTNVVQQTEAQNVTEYDDEDSSEVTTVLPTTTPDSEVDEESTSAASTGHGESTTVASAASTGHGESTTVASPASAGHADSTTKTSTTSPGQEDATTSIPQDPTTTSTAAPFDATTSTETLRSTHLNVSETTTVETYTESPAAEPREAEAETTTEKTAEPEVTDSGESLARENVDDSFPTEKSDPTPEFLSRFVTVNPDMFYGIFKASSTIQPEEPSSTSTTTTSTTTQSPSTTETPTTTTTRPPKATTAAPAGNGFVLGLEGLFNLKPADQVQPPVTRVGVSSEVLKPVTTTTKAPASSTSIPSFFGDGAPFGMLHFPWSTAENEYSGAENSLKNNNSQNNHNNNQNNNNNNHNNNQNNDNKNSENGKQSTETSTASVTSPAPDTTTIPSRVNLFSKKIAPTFVPTRTPPTGSPKKFNLFASLTNANNPTGHKADRRPELRPLKKVSGPWEPSIDPPDDALPETDDEDGVRVERKAFFGKPTFERRLVLEAVSVPPSTTRRPSPPPQFHPPTLLHDFASPADHKNYDVDDFLHRGTPATPRNAKTPISLKARTTLLMCAAIIGGAAIFFATLMVVCMRRTKNKRLIRRRAIDKFIQDAASESSSSYGGSHSSYGRKGLLARV